MTTPSNEPTTGTTVENTKSDLNVGDVLSLDTADRETIQTAQQSIWNLQQVLGEKYRAFKRDEMVLLQSIEKAEMTYDSVVMTVAKKNGIPVESKEKKYKWEPSLLTFTRTA